MAETIRFATSAALLAEVTSRTLAALAGNSPRTLALSGGRITRLFFDEVVLAAKAQSVSLAHLHFFFADERCLPPTHAESNFALAQTHLFEPLGIAADHVHRLRGELDPMTAAAEAEAELRRIVKATKDGQPALDLVFLGLGEDGHIASLFPHEAETMLNNRAAYRAVFDSPKPPPQRLTLGYRTIAAAHEVWVLASGAGKEMALRESLSPTGNTPLARLLRMRPEVKVFTDIKMG